MTKAQPYPKEQLYTYQGQRSYGPGNNLQVAFPIGGIGAGCVSLNAQGGIQDFSIRNQPDLTALPDAHRPTDSAFGVLNLPDLAVTRLLEGPMPREKIYDQGLKGQGHLVGGHQGMPRFRGSRFTGEFPFGYVELDDPAVPLSVQITGFNPFIPLDDRSSSLPCALLEYSFTNPTDQPVSFEFSYHLSHFAIGKGWNFSSSRNAVIPGIGAFMYNTEDPDSEYYGSCAVGVVGFEPEIKAMWFRGGWFDGLSVLWNELSTGRFVPNDGANASTSRGRNGASLLVKHILPPGESVTIPVIFTWYFPNVHYAHGEAEPPQNTAQDCGPDCVCEPRWKTYYSTQWIDARDVLEYARENYPSLRARTQAFHDALFSSTLPDYILDAVSANLGILKSPTVLRQSNGSVWAWEGCFATSGCCHGTCTHVWNYAQALPHLFPQLERTLREQELLRSMDENGHVNFRAALPDGPTTHTFHAASDGQLGGIMKAYREFWISGDREWLRRLYPAIKRSMDFCISTWDPDHLGVLVEPHHNTYDIEFWGPDGMCTSFYLGALAAMTQLSEAAGKPEDSAHYRELGQRGARHLEEQLFNGEYYQQNVTLLGLRASPDEGTLASIKENNPEEYALLMEEGPKYQYGSGCISDGVFGAWLAELCGARSEQSPDGIRSNLRAIFQYNFKQSLWDHANTQRPGYALGDEPGLLLCTWPNGGKPTLPFVYSDEVWTGIEYQAASHMIAAGLVDEGLTVVKALRSRYDGQARNPWNEYECGSYYARAMASYALLIALTGFRYDASTKTLYLAPRLSTSPLRFFFSTASGWGTVTIEDEAVEIHLVEGELQVDQIELERGGQADSITLGQQIRGSARIACPPVRSK
jgi:uncharacterized protein (DUF608 family)